MYLRRLFYVIIFLAIFIKLSQMKTANVFEWC